MKFSLQKIIDYGLLITLIIFPLSINIALISPKDPGHPLIAINLSLVDIFIGLLLMLWGFKTIVFKEWKQLKFSPAPILVFVGIVLISFVNAISISEWAKESVQMIEYFILFYFLLLNNFKSVKRNTIFYTIYISTTISLLISFIQHTIIDADVYFVCGLFENRNFLGAYLCMTIPLVFAEFLNSDNKFMKIWMAILLLITIWVIVTGSAILALIISLGVISYHFGKKTLIRYLSFITIIIAVFPVVFPEKNVRAVNEFLSIYEQGSISENYYRRLTILSNKRRKTLKPKNMGENYLLLTSEQYLIPSLPELQQGERYQEMENKKHIKNRYLEMQASLNLLSEHTLMGVGAGNFQQQIGTYYKELPKVNTAEPGQNNGYLIVATTLGILGLTSLIWLFIGLLKNIKIKRIIYLGNRESILGIGLYGAVLSCIIENFFVNIFSVSLMVPFIFLIYLSYINVKNPD